MIEVSRGLEDVIVGETAVSDVRGDTGELIYRGKSIDQLVDEPFTKVASLVVAGNPSLAVPLDRYLPLTPDEQAFIRALPRQTHAMKLLQAITPLIVPDDTFCDLYPDDTDLSHGLSIAVKIPLILAMHLRGELRPVDPDNGYIRRYLHLIQAPETDIARRTFEVVQILQLEHSFNASTFTARVVSSTLPPIENCLAAAFGALHGVLHGGADQAALETADEVGDPARADAFVDMCLKTKRKVMGMGHREYRVLDPRARHIKSLARELTRGTEHEVTYCTLAAMENRFRERMAETGKELHANIEFYKGVVYRALGLPPFFFTAHFAMARVFGYIAHVHENRQDNKLIRPAARYIGP